MTSDLTNHESDSESAMERAGLTARLERLQAGQLGPDKLESVFQNVHEQALKIARALHNRRGSPDGIAGASDLANSQMARICEKPSDELQNVATSDDLRRVLSRMMLDRWIDRRRREGAAKRGGGKVFPASQLSPQNSANASRHQNPIDIAPPTESELAFDLEEILDKFPAESEERKIIELLFAGHSQTEIGPLVGLSRDAVGRRIRQTIKPKLAKLLQADEEA